MRNELTTIQKIEKYLLGKLSKEEEQAFKKELQTNKTLQESVEKQKLIMDASERRGIKNAIKKGKKKYIRTKWAKYIGFGTLITFVIIASYLFSFHDKEYTFHVELPQQNFTFHNVKDTVIESKSGLIIAIPKNAFVDERGNTVTENISFQIKEAFDKHSILSAGLTTMSNGELLATGGMFFLEAYSNKQKLKLAKGKEILLDIPNNNPNPNMMLFDGTYQKDGTINWVNPQPFEKDLTTFDITTLDFYPKGYPEVIGMDCLSLEQSSTFKMVDSIVHDEEPSACETLNNGKSYSKAYTDSLYYSFGRLFNNEDTINYLNGKALFNQNCSSCHHPVNNRTGPRLAGVKYKWKKAGDDVYAYVKNPQAQYDAGVKSALAINYNRGGMPGQAVNNDEIDAILNYADRQLNEGEVDSNIFESDSNLYEDSKVEWTFSKIKVKENIYRLIVEAKIKKEWMLFVNNDSDNVPVGLRFKINNRYKDEYQIKSKKYTVYDENFQKDITYFKNYLRLEQEIRIKPNAEEIRGSIYFQIGTNKKMLSPSSKEFNISLTSCTNCQPSGINPAKIQAIWNKKYNNTILATKEFEARLQLIHELREDALLDVYINNINKPLWYSDSVVNFGFEVSLGKFQHFYEQRKGGVKVNDKLANSLARFYKQKQKDFTQKSSEAYKKYNQQKMALISSFGKKASQKQQKEFNRKMSVHQQELEVNLDEAYRQLGKERNTTTPNAGRLRARTSSLGAKNVDYFVRQSTRKRETLNYTDPNSGKQAVIEYHEVEVNIQNDIQFDKVFVYMIPDSLSSFNRMTSSNKVNFKGKLNELFKYGLFCLAYKDEQAYYFESTLSRGKKQVSLIKISEEELKTKLNRNSAKNKVENNIKSDIDFYRTEVEFKNKTSFYAKNEALTIKVGQFLFPELARACLANQN